MEAGPPAADDARDVALGCADRGSDPCAAVSVLQEVPAVPRAGARRARAGRRARGDSSGRADLGALRDDLPRARAALRARRQRAADRASARRLREQARALPSNAGRLARPRRVQQLALPAAHREHRAPARIVERALRRHLPAADPVRARHATQDAPVHGLHRQHLLAHQAQLSRLGAAAEAPVAAVGRARGDDVPRRALRVRAERPRARRDDLRLRLRPRARDPRRLRDGDLRNAAAAPQLGLAGRALRRHPVRAQGRAQPARARGRSSPASCPAPSCGWWARSAARAPNCRRG